MKNKKYFIISIIYFIAIISVAIIFALGYLGVLNNEYLSTFFIQIVVMFAIPMILYTLFVSKNVKKTFKDTGFNRISGKIILISIGLGFIIYFLNSYVADVFYSIIYLFGYESLSSGSTIVLDNATLFKEFILSTILPGICEEFLHRGILLHANKKSTNPRFVLIISSILFGLMHLNIGQFFYATFIGLFIGYVALASDSIFPCMIIHFMNNFLSSYFFYGPKLDLPFANIVNYARSIFSTNLIISIISSTLFIFVLLSMFIYLTRKIIIERTSQDIKKIVLSLKLDNLPIEEAQKKVEEINNILNIKKGTNIIAKKQEKPKFFDNIFIISSMVLGLIITISTFIWGII